MKRLLLAAPLLLAGLTVACGGSDSDPGLEIDPVNSCSGSKCQHGDAGKDDEVDPSAPTSSKSGDAGAPSKPPAADGGTKPEPTNTCETADDLGQMDGETLPYGSTPEGVKAEGHCSKWLKMRVNETSYLLSGLELVATLTSPAAHKFGLYVYLDPSKDQLSCNTPTKSSATTLSSVDTVDVTWGDSPFSDDSRTVTIEVRAMDSCDDTSAWSLVVAPGVDPLPPPSGF